MHPQRLITLICASIGLIACFLPWTGGDLTGSYNAGYEFWWGWIAILQNFLIVWISFVGNRKMPIPAGGARIAVLVASGFLVLETLALIFIMVIFPFGTALYGIYITLAMSLITLIVPSLINEKGKIAKPAVGDIATEFGSNAELLAKQINHLSQQMREGWRQEKNAGDTDSEKK